MLCTQRLYLTADRKTLVAVGNKKGDTLYAVPGDTIPDSAAERFGLVDGHLKGFDPAAASRPVETKPKADTSVAFGEGAKETAPADDKEAGAGSDKEQKAGDDKSSSGPDQGAGA